MSKVGIEEVRRLAELAKIGLTDEEMESLAAELGRIVEFVEKLNEADTANTPLTNQVTGLVDVWREDKVETTQADRDKLLSNAPLKQDGYIKVRRVLE